MGQVWSIDAVMKNASTTIYGNIVALDESPKKKGLLYAGTDDGLVQISDNDGQTWTKIASFPGIPANTRVNMLTASLHEENTVFAVFNNHRSGDFKPYILKSTDKGKTWTSISSNLPERGSVYCIKQDFVDPNLLFVGTEFGAYFSNDGGKNWTKLSGLPTIAVYDLDIQQRENDLVAATFGRGFWVLDNYSPLRTLNKENLDKKAHIFPVKDALLYIPADPLGLEGTGFQGANLWAAKNPEFGATFTLYIKDDYPTLKGARQEKEKALEGEKKAVSYPTFDELRKEQQEGDAQLVWIIRNDKGEEVRRLFSSPSKGISRMNWNLRYESTNAVNPSVDKNKNNGFLVPSGNYTVEISMVKDGTVTSLVEKTPFVVKGLNNQSLLAKDPVELNTFRKEVADLTRRVSGTATQIGESKELLEQIEHVLLTYPGTDMKLLSETRALRLIYDECSIILWGDGLKTAKEFEALPGINGRLGIVEYSLYDNTAGVTNAQRSNKSIAEEEYNLLRTKFDDYLKRLTALEKILDGLQIPYVKGRESWKEE
jgi:hypothetical protein